MSGSLATVQMAIDVRQLKLLSVRGGSDPVNVALGRAQRKKRRKKWIIQ
jgi:hypothetical protein